VLAYVRDVQRQERENKVSLLKHQMWSGVDLVDEMVSLATGGQISTKATGAGITESQFESKAAHAHCPTPLAVTSSH